MIPDEIMTFIILLVCAYLFEHKILPQIGVFAVALIQLYVIATSSSIVELDVYYGLLFVINMSYSSYMMVTDDNVSNQPTAYIQSRI